MKAEEYLKEMSKEIHNREVRDCIIQEYRDHLEDAIEALLVKGMSEVEAEEEAVRQMGDPEVAGRDMGRLYSKVLDLSLIHIFLRYMKKDILHIPTKLRKSFLAYVTIL